MLNRIKKYISDNTGFLIRLDDIAENMNWDMMEHTTNLFDKFGVRPVLGVIPNNKDPELLSYPKKNINFWDEIYPLFKKYSNNYYVVAGDVGANYNHVELFCNKFEKTIFLATGMGGGINDNYLIFKKIKNKIKIVPEVF